MILQLTQIEKWRKIKVSIDFIDSKIYYMDSGKFAEEVKNFLKNDKVNSEAIWSGMQGSNSEENVAYFCYSILKYIVQIDKKQTVKLDHQKLLSTLMVLQFYKNKKMKKKGVVEDIKKLLNKPEIMGKSRWVLEFFTNNFKEDEIIESLMSQWTLYPYKQNPTDRKVDPGQLILDNIYSMPINEPSHSKQNKHFLVLKHVSFPQRLIYEPKVLAFSYVCFMDYIRDHDQTLSFQSFTHLKNIFIAHIHALRNYSVTKQYLLTTVHLLESTITYYGCPYEDILKQLMTWADQMRNCPGFLGEIGHELFMMLHNELKSPGNAFRKRLRAQFPSLDMSKSSKINKEVYLVSSSIDDCCSRPEHCSLLTLRKLIIMHIIKVSKVSQDKFDKYYRLVQSLDYDLAYQTYYKLMKIIDIASSLQIYERVKKVQLDSVNELMQQIVEKNQKEKKQASILEVEDFIQLYRDSNPQGIFQYPTYEVVHINIDRFISKKEQNNFVNIAQKNIEEYPKLNFYQNKIPIVFYGDGFSFSKLLPEFVNYFENVNFQNSRNLKVYYIPMPEFEYRCGIAVYLAAKDLWYKRFIYAPFRQRMLVPHLQLNSKNKYFFPNYLVNKSFHMYLREAKRIVPLKVYRCHVYLAPQKSQKKDEYIREQKVLYFCSSILIGTSVDVEIIKVSKERDKLKEQKYSKIQFIEIMMEKLKKVENIHLRMKAECYDELTKQITIKEQENMKVEDIQILNIPRHYFMGKKPNPTSVNLQMTILLENYGKMFRKQIMNKDNFKKAPDNQIIKAFQDLFISLTVRSLQLSRIEGKEPFKIIIDGRVIKDIEKIKIEPAISKLGLPVSIPLMTFMPFQND